MHHHKLVVVRKLAYKRAWLYSTFNSRKIVNVLRTSLRRLVNAILVDNLAGSGN